MLWAFTDAFISTCMLFAMSARLSWCWHLGGPWPRVELRACAVCAAHVPAMDVWVPLHSQWVAQQHTFVTSSDENLHYYLP
jgi:hypothetical protein